MSGGAVIIIVDPSRPRQQTADGEPDGFAQALDATSPYAEALAAITEAEANGQRVRIIGD